MVVRLGFAVATALAPDVLITDEVLAVGDESFQKKCIAWMERYLADGGTLLLCSHGMYHVQKLCRSALWLQGRPRRALRPRGRRHAGLSRVSRGEERAGEAADRHDRTPWPRASTRSSRSSIEPAGRHRAGRGRFACPARCYSPDGRAPNVLIGIVRADGTPIYGVATDMDGVAPVRIATRTGMRSR